jgi:hypothetical protein
MVEKIKPKNNFSSPKTSIYKKPIPITAQVTNIDDNKVINKTSILIEVYI